MQRIEDFDFFTLRFDQDGKLKSAGELDELKASSGSGAATDVLLIAHGFRNDEGDATGLYTLFLTTLRAHLASPEFRAPLGSRRFAVGGVFWPSQQFPEAAAIDPNQPAPGAARGIESESIAFGRARRQLADLRQGYAKPGQRPQIDAALALLPSVEGSTAAQDEFVALVLSLFDDTAVDPTEGGDQIRARRGSDLLARLRTPVVLPVPAGSADVQVPAPIDTAPRGDGSVQATGGFFHSVIGQVNQFLNFTTWYLMKDRAGAVGAGGVADAVRGVRAAAPAVKLHLVGHSLGGRLMAACAKALSSPPAVPVDSLILLEAAFSHYGFSADNGHGTAGFFRDVIAGHVVKGPMVATHSTEDTVVGYGYAIASRLARDNTRTIGDAGDEFGGIGRNGTQATTEAVRDVLHAAGAAYQFRSGVVTNLDGSGGLIKDHGDVTNTTVTYAVASAIART